MKDTEKIRQIIEQTIWKHYKEGSSLNVEAIVDEIIPQLLGLETPKEVGEKELEKECDHYILPNGFCSGCRNTVKTIEAQAHEQGRLKGLDEAIMWIEEAMSLVSGGGNGRRILIQLVEALKSSKEELKQ